MISDLHLGQPGGISVLELARPLERLLDALRDVERLVLLGDLVELQEVPSSYSFPIAEPVLRAVGAALGPDRTAIVVPGNHDHALIREWAREQGPSLAREALVPPGASPQLEQVLGWLSPAHVEVRYPGVWLSRGVWATHGHYLNHYLRPVSSYGLLHPLARLAPTSASRPSDYEYLAAIPARSHIREGLPPTRWHDGLVPRQLAPLLLRMLCVQMRRHSLPAMAKVAEALGVSADAVLFGHVHRRGPTRGEDLSAWRGSDGTPRFLNTGAWRYEPVIMYGARPPHPYWPGGAVMIDDRGSLQSVGLLDDLSAADFR